MYVKNLQRPMDFHHDGGIVFGSVENGSVVVRTGKDDKAGLEVFRMSYHHKLAEIDPEILQHVARQLALAIRDARDLGFDQGRAFVRDALGVV